MHARTSAVFVTALSLLMLGGCDAIKKQKECNAIAETINEGIGKLDGPRDDLSSDDEDDQQKAVKKIGKIYGQLADDVREMPASDKELEELVEDYADMADDLKKLMDDLVEAVEERDEKAVAKAQKRVDKLEGEETRIVNRLSKHCNSL